MSALTLYSLLALGLMPSGHEPGAFLPAQVVGEDEIVRGAANALSAADPTRASTLLQTALKAHPRWTHVAYALARLKYAQSDYSSARLALTNLVQVDERHGAAWVLLGLSEFAMRDYHLALKHLEQGKRVGVPSEFQLDDAARYQIILCLILDGRFEQALLRSAELIEDPLTKADKHDADFVLAVGLASLRLPLVPKTARSILSVARLEAARMVGEARWSMCTSNSRQQADVIFSQLFQRYPEQPSLHFAYGSLLSALKEWELAAVQFQEELRSNPSSVPAKLGLSRSALERGDAEAGLPAAREAVRLGPGYFMAHYYLGRLLMLQGTNETSPARLSEGISELQQAARLEPDSTIVRFSLAQALRSAGRIEEFQTEIAEFERLKRDSK